MPHAFHWGGRDQMSRAGSWPLPRTAFLLRQAGESQSHADPRLQQSLAWGRRQRVMQGQLVPAGA